MAKTEEVTKALETAQKPKDLRTLIESSAKELGKALPAHLGPERLVRIALTCIRTNPELARCTPESFLGSLFTLAQLGLEPVAGRAYLLPFHNKRKVGEEWKSFHEVQAVVGYKGLADLFYRHDKAVELAWGVVYEKDDFTYEFGTEAFLRHRPALGSRGKVTGYWVMATLKGGGKPFAVMTHEECMDHGRRHSKTYDKKKEEFYSSSPWAKEPQAMCLKTVLIQLAKLLPLSIELQQAIAADETTRTFRPGIEPLDVAPTDTWSEPQETETTASEPAAKPQE
jgi:recombination protein RecT